MIIYMKHDEAALTIVDMEFWTVSSAGQVGDLVSAHYARPSAGT